MLIIKYMDESSSVGVNDRLLPTNLRRKLYLNLGALLSALGGFIGIIGMVFVIYSLVKSYQDYQLMRNHRTTHSEFEKLYQIRKQDFYEALLMMVLITIYYFLLIMVTMKEMFGAAIN